MITAIKYYCYLIGAFITTTLVLSAIGSQFILINMGFSVILIVVLILTGILASILNYVQSEADTTLISSAILRNLLRIGTFAAFGAAALFIFVLGDGAVPIVQDGNYVLIIRGSENQIVNKAEFLHHKQAMIMGLASLCYFLVGNVLLCVYGDCIYKREQSR